MGVIRESGGRSVRPFLVVVLAVMLVGCEAEGPGSTALVPLDAGPLPPGQDTGGPGPRDLADPDYGPLDTGGPADAVPDGGACFVAPYTEYAVVTGALSSYSRAANNPSIRQWADRANQIGYRALVLADHARRTENALPVDQFSDANPDKPAEQWVFLFDENFDRLTYQGAAAIARLITKEEEPELTFDPGVRLRGAADGGWASAAYEDELGFDYDVQNVTLMLRVKVPNKSEPSRVLVTVRHGLKQNMKDLTWVLAWNGDPGEGIPADFNAGATFHTYYLPLKEEIIAQAGDGGLLWREGAIWRVELRVEGNAEAIFDHIRLNVDAWFDDYRTETAAYSTSQLRFVPGVEHYFGAVAEGETFLGQFSCIGPNAYPNSDKDATTGLLTDFASFGCLTVADRPKTPGALMSDELVLQAEAVEIWHPSNAGEIDPVWWDTLLAKRGGPFPAIASAAPREVKELDREAPHNRVLAPELTEAGIIDAIRAGRTYMTDRLDASAEVWAEGTDCRRWELGEAAPEAVRLHVKVTCAEGIDDAHLVRVDLSTPGGGAVDIPLADAAEGAVVDVSAWPESYVRLEATCTGGGRIFTNPIWLTALP